MSSTKALERALGKHRKANGTPVVYLGVTYYAGQGTISDTEIVAFIPQAALNAGNADPRAFAFTPADFGTVPPPSETASLFMGGVEYTVVRAYMTPLGGSWRCLAYRRPLAGTSTSDTAQLGKWS